MEICLFGSKININYQIKFTLNLRYIYLIHINHSFTPKIKHVIRRNVCFGKCQFGDVPFGELSLGKCPFGELSIWRIVPLRNRRLGNCPLGKCLRGTVRWGNVFGELSIGEKYFGEKSVREMSKYFLEYLVRNAIIHI